MFASRYFADRYFAPRYWAKVGAAQSAPEATGASLRRALQIDVHASDWHRTQRNWQRVKLYLDALDDDVIQRVTSMSDSSLGSSMAYMNQQVAILNARIDQLEKDSILRLMDGR